MMGRLALALWDQECRQFIAGTCDEAPADIGVIPDVAWRVRRGRDHEAVAPASEEEHRKTELQNRLCADRELSCAYVTALLNDPRLTIHSPPEPEVSPRATAPKEYERNPYFKRRFGLLTSESLERMQEFIQAHLLAFDAAYHIYGVPREVICGHLRIETDFGIPTKLSPHPLGTIPAINRLVSLYVRKPSRKQPRNRFVHRQAIRTGRVERPSPTPAASLAGTCFRFLDRTQARSAWCNLSHLRSSLPWTEMATEKLTSLIPRTLF